MKRHPEDLVCMCRILASSALLTCLLAFASSQSTLADVPGSIVTATTGRVSTDTSSSRVNDLIQELGSPSYATRIRARQHLQAMGLEAFDELHAAQHNSDIEIEMAARHLVSSLMVSWSKETDPAEVRATLHEYGSQSEVERGSRIKRLAQLAPEKSFDALIRLTRFETSPRLSEAAALALMNQTMSVEETVRNRMSDKITKGLGDADRPPTQWLRIYAKDLLANDYSKDDWDTLIVDQREKIDAAAAHPATRDSVLELVRICASRAANFGDKPEAVRLAKDHLDLIQPTSPRLIDAATWAIDHELFPVVLELRQQFQRMFDSKPTLLYAAAEAIQIEGQASEADVLADKALNIEPMPSKEEAEKMSASRKQEIAQGHLDMARRLQGRGQFNWSFNEYRRILDAVEIDSWESAIVRLSASRMLGEQNKHAEIVEMLGPFVDRVDKDEKLRQSLQHRGLDLRLIRSELEYHTAEKLLTEGKMDDARKKMSLAYLKNVSNIDILIRMHRTQGDTEWRKEVKRLLDLAERRAEKSVLNARKVVRQNRLVGEADLSEFLNNYAWLVSNTEGDFDKALRYSLESLELEIDGAKYDTCARCYFAVGDFKNAVETQKKAIALLPHSPPLERQLAEFEKALAEQ